MASDGLKHGRPQPTISVLCDCECSRYMPCPADSDNPCKMAYKAHLKAMKAERDKKAAKNAG